MFTSAFTRQMAQISYYIEVGHIRKGSIQMLPVIHIMRQPGGYPLIGHFALPVEHPHAGPRGCCEATTSHWQDACDPLAAESRAGLRQRQ
jgi:hypothetical protein